MKKIITKAMIFILLFSSINLTTAWAAEPLTDMATFTEEAGAIQTPLAQIPPNELSGITICIDPGHGTFAKAIQEPVAPNSKKLKAGFVSGTAGATRTEAEVNLAVGLMLKEKLEAKGAKIIMTREGHEATLSNVKRAQLANDNQADMAIRIHCDGNASKTVSGMSMLVPDSTYMGEAMAKKSTALGEVILKNTLATTGAKSRGVVVRSDLAGFNWSTVPTVLIEMGFLTNPQEDARLSSWEYQQKLANGITAGIVAYAKTNLTKTAALVPAPVPAPGPAPNPQDEVSPDIKQRIPIYQGSHPNTPYKEAMWKIKVNMDQPEFSQAQALTAEEMSSISVLVNKRHKVPDGYVPADLVQLTGKVSLRAEAKNAFDRMQKDAKIEGYQLYPVSGFRTIDYQKNLYNRYLKSDSHANVETYSARPGFSEHHTGLALDVAGRSGGMSGFGQTKDFQWVLKNGHKYGFIIRYYGKDKATTGYKSEPWHLRYVGIDIATVMQIEGITTFEEYTGKYLR